MLDISNNEISFLPPELGYLDSLARLAVEGNPIRSIRRSLLVDGTVELKKYLRTRAEPPEWSIDHVDSKGGGGGDPWLSPAVQERVRELSGGVLDLSSLALTDLPMDLAHQLRRSHSFDSDDLSLRVREVNLMDNNLSMIPQALDSLTSVQNLNLSRNQLSSLSHHQAIPHETGCCSRFSINLKVLHLSRNGLSSDTLDWILQVVGCYLSYIHDQNCTHYTPFTSLSPLLALFSPIFEHTR